MLEIVFGENSAAAPVRALQDVLKDMDISGTLYLGYPVLSTADAKVFVDALLISRTHGLVAFDLSSHLDASPDAPRLEKLAEHQNQIYASIYNKLNMHRDLRKERTLAVTVNVVTWPPPLDQLVQREDVVACSPDMLPEVFRNFDALEDEFLRPLNAAIQRVSTLRPPRRRENVKKANSRGAILKKALSD